MTDKKEDITEFFERRNNTSGLVEEMKYDLEDDDSLWGNAEIDATSMLENSNVVTIPPEFSHVLKVLQTGVDKGYKANGWLHDQDSPRMSHTENHDSMFHHIAESYSGMTQDTESGRHPRLHAAARCLMGYTRWKRGINSDRD